MALTGWENQNVTMDGFTFRRDAIRVHGDTAPPAIKELYEYLLREDIRRWFSDISNRRCDSFRASSTIFNNGDNITEHNDRYIYEQPGEPRYTRALTFNYYLTKNWNPAWGGNFVWKQPYRRISPSFNKLILFIVTTNSHHWVEPVNRNTPYKRLSITGWYLTEVIKENYKLAI